MGFQKTRTVNGTRWDKHFWDSVLRWADGTSMTPEIENRAVVELPRGLKPAVLGPVLWGCALAVCLALTCANLYFGDLNQDEGWYLYAARLVHEGKAPYRDFAFTQGPAMAYVYSLAHPVVEAFGVAGGRLVTALLGLSAALCAAWLASGMAAPGRKKTAALLAFILAAVNVYQSYFCTIVKTYSLCALLIVLGFLCLAGVRRRYGALYAMASGMFLVLAAGTRISAGIILPIAFLFLVFGRKSSGLAWFWFGLGAGLTTCAVFIPFLVAARENLIFGVVQYHAGRTVSGVAAQAVYKAGFVSRVVQGYSVAIGLFAALMLARIFRAREVGGGAGQGVANMTAPAPSTSEMPAKMMLGMVWSSVAAVSLVHISAPFPYDDYQAAIFPLFTAALACGLARIPRSEKAVSWLLVTVFLLSGLSAFSSPINQSWVVSQRDRIWWRLKTESSLERLRKAGARVRALSGPDRLLLTQDTYLAVESGLNVPHGLEMGPFSYYPELDDVTALRRHVLNTKMLRKLLETSDASVAAFSGYGLAIKSPGVVEIPPCESAGLWKIVNGRYRVEPPEIPFFGQDLTTLRIMVRTSAVPAEEQKNTGAGVQEGTIKQNAE